jgi:photosystem I subunit VIII
MSPPAAQASALRDHSLQYRRLYVALAMTGEFAAAWLPSVLVPLVGIMGPAVAMALLFNVIEARD